VTHDIALPAESFEALNLGLQRAVFQHGSEAEVGDGLRLSEYDPESGRYSGRWLHAKVTHVAYLDASLVLISVQRVRQGSGQPYVLDVRGSRVAA